MNKNFLVIIIIYFFLLGNICFSQNYKFPLGENYSLENVTSAYGPRSKGGGDYPNTGYKYDFHAAIDIGAPVGTSVYPIMSGTIEKLIDTDNNEERIYIKYTDAQGSFLVCYFHVEIVSTMFEGKEVTKNDVVATVREYSGGGNHLDIRYIPVASYSEVIEGTWRNAENPGILLTNDVHHFDDSPIILDANGNSFTGVTNLQIENDVGNLYYNQSGDFFEYGIAVKRTEVDLKYTKVFLEALGADNLIYTEMQLLREPETTNDNRNMVDIDELINCGDITNGSDVGHNSKSVGIYPNDLGKYETYHDVYFRWYVNSSLWATMQNVSAKIVAQDQNGDDLELDPVEFDDISINNIPETCDHITFSPIPGSYNRGDESIQLSITTDLNIDHSNEEYIVFNRGTSEDPPNDIDQDHTSYWIGSTLFSPDAWYYKLYNTGTTIIKARVVRQNYGSLEYLSEQCEATYNLSTITGVNDYININLEYNTYNTNQDYLPPAIESNFVDVDPNPNDPDYIINWENWKVYANDGCEDILIMDRSDYVNIPPLPEGYDWERDDNGYVIGRIERSGTDNDGFYHTGATDIKIVGVPNTFLTSGTLQCNTIWCGYQEITGTVTIPLGKTLTIRPNSYIIFKNNASLQVYGTLIINNDIYSTLDFVSPYNNNGEYNGIDIKQGGSATINHAEIKNAQYGIKAEKTAITVENSDIHNCVIGTYLYWTNDYGFSEIHSNNLHDNSSCGLYVYHSEAKARDNQIKNNENRGVFAGNHSTLYLGEAGYAGNNNISNNTTVGIFSDYGSYMFLGRETCTLQGGNNIVNNPSKNARASGYGSVIQAENTWWGSNNQSTITSKFYIYHGDIFYNPWLSSEPSGVLSKSVTTPEESVYNAAFTLPDKSEPESEVSKDKQYNYDSKWSIYWKLLYARNLVFVEDYKFAREICREVIDENPDSSLSFWALNLLGVASYQDDPEGFKEYLQKKTSTKEKKQLYGSMELILSGYETTKSSKEASIDKTTTKYEGTYIEEVGLLQKFMYYLNEEKDEKTARSISDELDKKFPKTVSAVEAHRFLGDDVKESEEIKGEIAKENGKDDNESIPEKYELLGNYPNPFNPSTTIKYALPYNSKVELSIYDMNGKEIRKFVINTQSKGYGNVVWDGTNNNGIQVSSGVYVYKFKAISLEGNGKVFEKSAKLMLLK